MEWQAGGMASSAETVFHRGKPSGVVLSAAGRNRFGVGANAVIVLSFRDDSLDVRVARARRIGGGSRGVE